LQKTLLHTKRAQIELGRLSWFFSAIHAGDVTVFASRGLSVAEQVAIGGLHMVSAAQKSATLIDSLSTQGAQTADMLSQVAGEALLANRHLSIAEAEGQLLLAAYPESLSWLISRTTMSDAVSRIAHVRSDISVSGQLLSIMPDLVGYGGKKDVPYFVSEQHGTATRWWIYWLIRLWCLLKMALWGT